jgi:hypothetical protein
MLTEYQKQHPAKAALKDSFQFEMILVYISAFLLITVGRFYIEYTELRDKHHKLELNKNELYNKYLDLNSKYKDCLNGR